MCMGVIPHFFVFTAYLTFTQSAKSGDHEHYTHDGIIPEIGNVLLQ